MPPGASHQGLSAVSASQDGGAVRLMTPRPRNSATVAKPSAEPSSCLKKLSWSMARALSVRWRPSTRACSGAHSGHSSTASPRADRLKECMHKKCTAGSSSGAPVCEQRLSWKTRAVVLSSATSARRASTSASSAAAPLRSSSTSEPSAVRWRRRKPRTGPRGSAGLRLSSCTTRSGAMRPRASTSSSAVVRCELVSTATPGGPDRYALAKWRSA
mmetsp:Transcript_22941/g.71806  ORF Transcript_22941/g.71806 Transcript_22941/m.71806 type:complete len:215 (+) Transcript_22941:707-1351(+)